MTKHEADVIGGLNMTDQISNEAYKQIMIAAQDETEVGNVLDKIREEIENHCGLVKENHCKYCSYCNSVMGVREIIEIIDKYKAESEGRNDG